MKVATCIFLFLATTGFASTTCANEPAAKPNVLFIAVDDLRDWIGCLGGDPQAKTPNFDRLAKSGLLFTNAHCPAASCNPSRSAILTGRAPNESGLYSNGQSLREVMPDAVLLPQQFRNDGYTSAGSGKLLHYVIDSRSWDEYFPEKSSEFPIPQTYYPAQRPVSLSRAGEWQYVEADWGPMPVGDEEFGGDYAVASWIGERLSRKHEQPFFLACGIYRPHEPWFVPQEYFDLFPLESIELPADYKANDLSDVPASGQAIGRNRYFEHIQAEDQWKKGVQGYLASIAFADRMLGRVLDALEAGPNKDDTIVVLWSDHGWHLGSKEHWQKFTAWRAVTRVPLMVRVPPGISPTLPDGTTAGSACDRPVSLLSLYPTLTDLCGLAPNPDCDGPSLLPLLSNPEVEWPHVAVTYLDRPGSFGVSASTDRYIRYADGEEEYYDIVADPYEWTNLVDRPELAERVAELRRSSPKKFADKPETKPESLPKLTWADVSQGKAPASNPDGATFSVHFFNRRTEAVELFWMEPQGGSKSYGKIEAGGHQLLRTRPGAVWMIRDSSTNEELGHFRVGDRSSQAVIE